LSNVQAVVVALMPTPPVMPHVVVAVAVAVAMAEAAVVMSIVTST